MSRNKTTDFLAALSAPPAAPAKPARARATREPAAKVAAVAPPVDEAKMTAAAARHHSRTDKKHFGGYLDADTLEIAAVLRVRLKLDNSELIKFALEELDRSHKAKRAFGDA